MQCPNPDFSKPVHRWSMLQRVLVEAIVDLLTPDGKVTHYLSPLFHSGIKQCPFLWFHVYTRLLWVKTLFWCLNHFIQQVHVFFQPIYFGRCNFRQKNAFFFLLFFSFSNQEERHFILTFETLFIWGCCCDIECGYDCRCIPLKKF